MKANRNATMTLALVVSLGWLFSVERAYAVSGGDPPAAPCAMQDVAFDASG